MNLRDAAGFLGTDASLMVDITLLAYVLLIVPAMLVGYVFARRKMFIPHHKITMTLIVIVNWILIGYVMAVSYNLGVAPNVGADPTNPALLLPTIHLLTGAIAQILATYLVLRMWLENVLPSALMVKNIKVYMRTTLALWLITALLGVGIYALWYVVPPAVAGDDAPPPVATEEADAEATDEPIATEDAEAAADPVETEEAEPAGAAINPIETEDADVDAAANPVATQEVIPPAATAEVSDDDDDDMDDDDDDGFAAQSADAPVATQEVIPPAATVEVGDDDDDVDDDDDDDMDDDDMDDDVDDDDDDDMDDDDMDDDVDDDDR